MNLLMIPEKRGLTEVLGIAAAAVRRNFRVAGAWLIAELAGKEDSAGS
jgi:hypothetical protein